ncbi:uncharacterized protein LOC112568650 isoform X2 [Pomacea canaliculata]|uniref:uncharacterized protein LOC112568650 isoform X2 n=1 Tax=Pomacea canaliculata TaxID=400727 RepID=UPI000D732EF2|nr:uncharacterized protein LOC112568650 isoform X2 [Pomacea canaliculata]
MAPAVKSVCLETRPLVLLLILMNFISDGTSEAISLSCPLLQEGSIVKFNCIVQTSACNYTSVFFDFVSNVGVPTTPCRISFSSPCNQQPADGMTCGCVSSDSDFKTYQLNFLGNTSLHDGGKLSCNTNCLTGSPAVCQPLSFAVTSHSPSASTSSKSPSTETGDKGSGNSLHVLKTGILASVCGIIALISTHLG